MTYPELFCYPSPVPDVSVRLVAWFLESSSTWISPGEIYYSFPDRGEHRLRYELKNLVNQGILKKDARGYSITMDANTFRPYFAFKETPTQRAIIADIRRKGFVYARQFLLSGKGGSTQFLRAIRVLEKVGIVKSEIQTVPNLPHIMRRVYTFTDRAINPDYPSVNRKRKNEERCNTL